MASTHTFELKVGNYTFEGECEYTDAGLLSWKETGENNMPENVEKSVQVILELLGPLPEKYTDLKSFELKQV